MINSYNKSQPVNPSSWLTILNLQKSKLVNIPSTSVIHLQKKICKRDMKQVAQHYNTQVTQTLTTKVKTNIVNFVGQSLKEKCSGCETTTLFLDNKKTPDNPKEALTLAKLIIEQEEKELMR
jgi:hypothetical protein